MIIPEMRAGESIYEYISRVQDALGTDYVYILYGPEVLGPVRGNVDIETAERIIEYAKHLVNGVHPDFNAVIATTGEEDQIAVKKLGDDAYIVAFIPKREEKVMRFEELIV